MQFSELAPKDIDFLEYIGGELMDLGDGYAQLAFEIQAHHTQHLGVWFMVVRSLHWQIIAAGMR